MKIIKYFSLLMCLMILFNLSAPIALADAVDDKGVIQMIL